MRGDEARRGAFEQALLTARALIAGAAGTDAERRAADQLAAAFEGAVAQVSAPREGSLASVTPTTPELLDALARKARALEVADRRKDEFLAVLAHELRNPLAAVTTALYILRRRTEDAAARERAQGVIERQVEQITRLVDDLYDVSRITGGKLTLRRERLDVGSVLARAAEAARPLVDRAGHQLFVGTPAERLEIDADPVRLQQVLTNLLNNAIKFTEPPGKIWISGARENGSVAIRVKDTGIGMEPDALASIFELFVQVRSAAERVNSGLGIGLTLARSLVEMHGGRIHAASDGPGKGSELTVRLPLVERYPARLQGVADVAVGSGGPAGPGPSAPGPGA